VFRTAAIALVMLGCESSPRQRQLGLDHITVGAARLRTDTVGDGKFTERATFALVDAANDADEGAYVTLAGELLAAGSAVGAFKPQSLWVPAHGERTFALVDSERVERASADGARVVIKGAAIDTPPVMHVEAVRDVEDYGKRVVQGELVNTTDRPGTAMVIASFHDAHGEPMTRPFELVAVPASGRQGVQLVGPAGSVRGDLYIGDIVY
jgi:hypothetical protein